MMEFLPLLLEGAWVTVQLTVLGTALAVPLAIAAALGRQSAGKREYPGSRALHWLCNAYVEVLRGLPLLVLLFWLFFVLPLPPFHLDMSAYQVAVIGLGLHFGAYGAELLRGAFKAVPTGQFDACTALNFGRWAALRRIILPQVLRAAMAPATNLLIELLKNTSLLSLVTLADLALRARQLDQATFATAPIYALTLSIYFVLAQAIRWLMDRLARRLQRGLRAGALR